MSTRVKKFPWAAALGSLLVVSVGINILFLVAKPEGDSGVMVVGIIDGDTLVLEGKVKVRVRHVDAPEFGFCGGNEAKEKLESLVVGERVRLDEQIPDQYGRSMALIYKGSTLVNQELLASGWVRYHHDTSTREEELKAANEAAKLGKLGIFGECQSKENTANPLCFIKGNIDKQSGAKKYYMRDCAQYAFTIVEKDVGEDWFCSEKDARKAGYVKAETCKDK